MKRTILFLLSLLLFAALLTACDTVSPQETISVTLPTLNENPYAAESGTDKTVPRDTEARPGETKALEIELPHPEGSYYGEHLSTLPEAAFEDMTLWSSNGLMWRETVEPASAEENAQPRKRVCGVTTEDGETVSGWIAWTEQPDGVWTCEWEGLTPAVLLEEPDALAEGSEEEAEALLGPAHTHRTGDAPCWYTLDGKLLTLYAWGVAELTDVRTGETAQFAGKDTVCVVKKLENDTQIVNEVRWQSFLETAARGEPDALTLRIAGAQGMRASAQVLTLSYDGKVYTISDENGSEDYACLIVDSEGPRSAQDKFSSAVYCLLSDDPEMSWDRYFAQKIVSKPDPDFPRTRNLFTVYFYD